MTEPSRFVATDSGRRLDRTLADLLGCGRRRAASLIREGRVRVNGRRAAAATLIERGAEISVEPGEPPTVPTRRSIPRPSTRVVWQDHCFFCFDKPAGLHSLAGRSSDSLAERILHERPEQARVCIPAGEAGIVHRLDRDTSGLLLCARTADAYREARAWFRRSEVVKHYLALVSGRLARRTLVEEPLVRLHSRVRRARRGERALEALTELEPLEAGTDWTLALARMRSGVTHQVRVHLALVGHPLLGDAKYGGPPAPRGTRAGHLLHASRIILPGGADVSAPAPSDFLAALARLRSRG